MRGIGSNPIIERQTISLARRSDQSDCGLRQQVDRAAAVWQAATADDTFLIFGETVVEREFLARLDVPEREIKNVASDDAGFDVGFAGVIDEFSTAAAFGTVDIPIGVKSEEAVDLVRFGAALALFTAYELAGVFEDLAALGDAFQRKNTPAVNLAGAHLEAKVAVLRNDLGGGPNDLFCLHLSGLKIIFGRRRLLALAAHDDDCDAEDGEYAGDHANGCI